MKQEENKALLIIYDQAFHERILSTLDRLNCRGYTYLESVRGRGTRTGIPHYGSHAWPGMNSSILSVVKESRVESLLKALHELDVQTPQLGLRAFVWTIEQSI